MRVLTAEEMMRCDEGFVALSGIPSIVLMENAGRLSTDIIIRCFRDRLNKNVMIITGPGDNGGDGFCIARTLKLLGIKVSVWAFREIEKLSGDAATQAQAYIQAGGEIFNIAAFPDWEKRFESDLLNSSLIVDALFGIGFKGSPSGESETIIIRANASNLPIVAIDIPSGVDASSGKVEGVAIKADLTIAIQYPKIGHLLYPGASYAGEIVVADVGIVAQSIARNSLFRELLTMEHVGSCLKERFANDPEQHKGKRGHVVVIGGSSGHYGAPRMSAEAALKCGAGLVTLVLPLAAAKVVAPELVELMCAGLPDEKNGNYESPDKKEIIDLLNGKNAVVIGPGLGKSSGVIDLVKEVFNYCSSQKIPIVVDADALNLIAQDQDLRLLLPEGAVITPHPGEMARLLNLTTKEVQNRRIESAILVAKSLNANVVHKGARTIIADYKGYAAINPSATETLATAGSGDVLAGMIGALLGRGFSRLESACFGAFIHGYIGEMLELKHNSPAGYVASDIIGEIPRALSILLQPQSKTISFTQNLVRYHRGSRLV